MSSLGVDNQWLFKKEDLYRTPSAQNNIGFREEKESRSKGVLFIITVGMHLKLPQLTMATAALFFHRFYMRHSLTRFKFYDVGAACLYLASKTEESTRKFKDVIVACAQKAAKKDVPFDDNSKEYRSWKDTIVHTEEVLLEALCFELTVEHPYHYLLALFENHFTKDQHHAANEILDQYTMASRGRSYDKMLPGSKPGSEYQENSTPAYAGYLNSPAKLTTPAYNADTPTNGDRSLP
ncbi:hypothetical protein BGZ74_005968 [Mortierella antarctica]|nr:hypothetical protein BGZ74_005968 [Mortierella antarctica]